ncbi:MAG: hypothetical protein IJE50_00500 [Clostridia bacterium]|nr:hypothetical protein [Clostridia bacterium]MBQ2913992.1 hypothetical protein [Clostridia bacterium]MBQ4272140.1 hypothetical protein [Clostridia bacterium]MBR1955430.1 hypothetical protein [Clostridia bacterium]
MALTKIELAKLLGVYGPMLTQKQRDALAMYCEYDCSLSEIADEVGISRQGVRDLLVNAEKTLTKLEENLHLSQFVSEITIAVANNDMEKVSELVNGYVAKE